MSLAAEINRREVLRGMAALSLAPLAVSVARAATELTVTDVTTDIKVVSGGGGNVVTFSTTAGVNVSIPLYQQGAEYSSIRSSRESLAQARLNLDEARRTVTSQVTQAWQSLATARAQILARQEQPDQDRDDRDHHQQLDQREPRTARTAGADQFGHGVTFG